MLVLTMVLFSLTLSGVSFAQSTATGVAFPIVVPSHVTAYLNSINTVNFTVTLYNGTAGNTCAAIGNSGQLQQAGIRATIAPSTGVPPFNGVLSINVSGTTTAGNYTVQLGTACADPSSHGIAVVYLVVLNQVKPATTTTAPATTMPPTTTVGGAPTTTAPTTTAATIPPTAPPTFISTTVLVAVLAIVIIAIILLALWWYIRHR